MTNQTTPSKTSTAQTPTTPKRSGLETIKEDSRHLRGGIADELTKDTECLSKNDVQILKFHGSYQQEDRDARKNRRKEGLGKHHIFMVRCKIPGGRVTAEQYLAVDQIAGKYANQTLRITTRQGFQLHGVLKANLKETIAGINESLLTTLGACGDVNRNVMVDPAPYHDGLHAQLQDAGARIAQHLAPRSRAYHEIWLNGEPAQVNDEPEDVEPIYGKFYLPRKFKIGLALPDNNLIDIYSQDLGFLAVVENGNIAGYNVMVGGGIGMTHGNANTFPHLSRPVCYIPADQIVSTAEAVVKLFRDHGNRENRKRARIKYVMYDWGADKFRQVLSEYTGTKLADPKPIKPNDFDLCLGWHPQGNGQYWYGVSIENGRIKDEGSLRLRTAMRKIVEKFKPEIRLTPQQDLLLCNLEENARPEIEKILKRHGVATPYQLSLVQQFSMSCPAIPTCGLAISESERALPGIIDELEEEIKRLGLDAERISVRMTGCPNGCARPYQSDIGIVGRSGEKYSLFVGGNIMGNRLNLLFQDLVPLDQIVPTLVPVLEHFQTDRRSGEGFGDFCQRLGVEALVELVPEDLRKPAPKSHLPPAAPEKTGGSFASSFETVKPSTDGVPHAHNGAGLKMAANEQDKEAPKRSNAAPKQVETETFFAGPAGSEIEDYAYHYNADGSVRETTVCFYGENRRAPQASPSDSLTSTTRYDGRVEIQQLSGQRKCSETVFTGAQGREHKDRRLEYHPDGSVARTTIYYYEGDRRASEAAPGAALRRQVVYCGEVS